MLFNVDKTVEDVTVLLVGEKRGNALYVRGRSLLPIMKVIPLSEAKAKLSHYGHQCQKEPVIVTVNGVPAFQLVPLSQDDDLIDRLLEHNPAFRQTLRIWLKEKSLSTKDARRRL